MLKVNNRSKLRSLALGLGCLASIALAPSLSGAQTSAPLAEGPVAFTGHGALFDRAGNELAPTPELIEQAQAFYLNLLLGLADDEQRQSFRELEAQLVQGLTLDRQSRLVVNARLIERLIHSVGPEDADRLLSINHAIEFELERRLPATLGERGMGAPFQVPAALQQRLQQAGLAPTAGTAALVADAGGAAYRQLCRDNGVPVPPDWGTDAWAFRGILDKEFISGSLQAEVFAFKSPTPEGACLALPRFNQDDNILFLGVICLGKASGKACFWDNYKNGNKVIWQRGQDVPLSDFGGGTELLGGDVCSDCHAGENPFILHPNTALGSPNLDDLPLSADWYEPLVAPGWPQNPGPFDSPGACARCHTAGGPGGRFPAVSNQLSGYCGVLDTAIERTMPPEAPGSLKDDPHPKGLQALCDQPPKADRWAGAIWRHTGSACAGASCLGWQRLDNNVRTVAIAAGGNALYQLHYDGRIYRSTGVACSGESCPGWKRLDQNPRTIAITAGGNAGLYQLHSDGRIWRWTGSPCSGQSCNSWQLLDNNPRTVAIAASGSSKLYQLHSNGTIERWTGAPCSGTSCPGWEALDKNPRTIAIAATGPNKLFQMHSDGRLWQFTGAACSGATCNGWQKIDNNPNTVEISTNGGKLFQRHRDGRLWEFNGTPCSGESCGNGWRLIDNRSRTSTLEGSVYQLEENGRVRRWTGQGCTGATSCPGWSLLDHNPQTRSILASEGANDQLYQLHGPKLFQLHNDGAIWQSRGAPCTGGNCPSWQQIDNFAGTKAITAGGGELYQIHKDGSIWQFTGEPCASASCANGWRRIDNNPNSTQIVASGGQLYQRHHGGAIWRFTGQACSGNSCPDWQMLDQAKAVEIVAGGGKLYQRLPDGSIWQFAGQPCGASGCHGWLMLDNNPKTVRIAAGGGQLYQRHADGRIWRFTGQTCSSATSCPGWQMLDSNPQTKEIFAGGGELFQLHKNGRIWEATGAGCAGSSCPGWRLLDTSPTTIALSAADGVVYQLQSNGGIWRSTGGACTAGGCPGWVALDNNPRTVAIEAAHE